MKRIKLDSINPVAAIYMPKEIKGSMEYCAFCEEPGDLACSACYRVVYCCEDHQRQHWISHEIPCANYGLRWTTTNPDLLYQGPFIISEEKDLYGKEKQGFQMLAQVTIPANEKILEEVPLLIAPWPRTKLRQCEEFCSNLMLRIASLTCFGCCSALELSYKRCYYCNLPLCSNCPNLKLHTDNECKIIKNYQHFCKKSTELDRRTSLVNSSEEEIEFLYEDVMMVRLILLLMKEDEKVFGISSSSALTSDSGFQGFKSKRWINLLQTWKLHEETRKTESTRGVVTFSNLTKVFPYSLFLVNFNTSLVWRLFCILEANAFTFNMPFQRFHVLCSLLPKVHHSCFPNAHAFLTYREPETQTSGELAQFFSVTVQSGRTIPKGSHITISYIPLVYNLFERRLILLDRYFFWCRCERCFDPTEKGTFTSSSVCSICRQGFVMPSLDLLLKGPGPKPSDPFSVKEVQEAEQKYKTILNEEYMGWTCSLKNCKSEVEKRGSVDTVFKTTTAKAIEKYCLQEMASTKCLGKFDMTSRFRSEFQQELHSANSIMLKLSEDILRGELYNLFPKQVNITQNSIHDLDYTRTVTLVMDAYDSFMKKVNPAFNFQGFPVEILNILKEDYSRRAKAKPINRMIHIQQLVRRPRPYRLF